MLQHISGRAGHDRVEQRLVVSERREHQTREIRQLGTQLPADTDAVAVRQPHVENGNVRAYRGHAGERLGCGGCLADNFDVPLGFEQVAHPASHHFVVVEQEHADRRSVIWHASIVCCWA